MLCGSYPAARVAPLDTANVANFTLSTICRLEFSLAYYEELRSFIEFRLLEVPLLLRTVTGELQLHLDHHRLVEVGFESTALIHSFEAQAQVVSLSESRSAGWAVLCEGVKGLHLVLNAVRLSHII